MVRPVENDRSLSLLSRSAHRNDVESTVSQIERGFSREPANLRCVQHLDLDSQSGGYERFSSGDIVSAIKRSSGAIVSPGKNARTR
jgi:hypothetical protein